MESSRPLIEQQSHELTVNLPQHPVVLDADPIRLSQVFLNLLNNAAKFTPKGGRIDLSARREGSDVLVSVKDNGMGIPAAYLMSVFDMFSQVEGALSRSQGGLGIGLCLVKRLVEMHGGRVEVKSEGQDLGSEFLVRLPMIVERSLDRNKTGLEGEPSLPSSDLSILVVDDNKDAAVTLARLLENMGNTTIVAHDGEEAVESAERCRPDVVLLDIGLPKMNGYEAARAIRQKSWGQNMILIAVTGWGQDEDRRKSKEAGFDRHVVKPLDPRSLMKLLAELQGVKA